MSYIICTECLAEFDDNSDLLVADGVLVCPYCDGVNCFTDEKGLKQAQLESQNEYEIKSYIEDKEY